MGTQLQIVFDKIEDLKQEKNIIKNKYKDLLEGADGYEELKESIKELREKKKQIEISIQGQMEKEMERLDEINREIKSNKEILNDIAINYFSEGKTVEVCDKYKKAYEPQWSVKFTKKK